jgi:hypothetical protein
VNDGHRVSGIRPILVVRLDSGESLLITRLSSVGANSQSNRFVLRRTDLRPPWPQPEKGYFGFAEVAAALIANGWRGCTVEIMPARDTDEARSRKLALRKLTARLVEAMVQRPHGGAADAG